MQPPVQALHERIFIYVSSGIPRRAKPGISAQFRRQYDGSRPEIRLHRLQLLRQSILTGKGMQPTEIQETEYHVEKVEFFCSVRVSFCKSFLFLYMK